MILIRLYLHRMILVPHKAFVSLCLLFFSFSAIAQQENLLAELSWLEGNWVNPDSTVVEQWNIKGEMMMGSVFRINGLDDLKNSEASFEFLETLELKVKEEQLVYVAITKEHKEPMDFIFTPLVPNTFSFHNKDNDFPKWIIYQQFNPGKLLIILKNEEKSKEFHFQKITP